MDDIDASELPDYDDVAVMVSVDENDRKVANDTELVNLFPQKETTEGSKEKTDTNKPISADRKSAIKKLKSMGYTDMTATIALDSIHDYAPNNAAMAVEWIMEHPQDTDTNVSNKKTVPAGAVSELMEGPSSTTTTTKKKVQPLEIANPPSNTGNDTGNDTGNNNANGEDCKQKCMDCMEITKVYCGDCVGNTNEKYNNMSRNEKKVFWGAWAGLCCIGVLLTIILIPVSIRKVEFDEYAIKYDDLTKTEDSQEFGEGRYVFTPKTKLFIYDSLIQKLSLSIDCLTRDGIVMFIEVDIQYSIPQTSVYEIWEEFGKEHNIDKYFALVSSDAIRDAIGTFHASAFYRNRFGIQTAIEVGLTAAASSDAAKTHLVVVSAVLAGYTYPDELKKTIKIKRAAENEIVIVVNERNGNLTDADTNYRVSIVNAQRLLIQGKAEVESLLAEATAHANAITARFDALQTVFVAQANRNGWTGKQFMDYWLTAFVLLEATRPITNTLSDIICCADSGQFNTPSPIDVVSNVTAPTIVTTSAAQTTQYFTSMAPSVSPVTSPP